MSRNASATSWAAFCATFRIRCRRRHGHVGLAPTIRPSTVTSGMLRAAWPGDRRGLVQQAGVAGGHRRVPTGLRPGDASTSVDDRLVRRFVVRQQLRTDSVARVAMTTTPTSVYGPGRSGVAHRSFPTLPLDGTPSVRPRPACSPRSATTRPGRPDRTFHRAEVLQTGLGATQWTRAVRVVSAGPSPQPVTRPEQRGVAACCTARRASPSTDTRVRYGGRSGNSRRACQRGLLLLRRGIAEKVVAAAPRRIPWGHRRIHQSGGESSTVDNSGPSVLTDHPDSPPARHSGAG